MKKKTMILGGAGIALIVAVLLILQLSGVSLLSLVTEAPDCQWNTGGGTCLYNITLAKDRSLTSLIVTTDSDSVASSTWQARTKVTPLSSVNGKSSTSKSDSEITVQLYRTPAGWKNIQEVLVEATVSSNTTCGRSDVSQMYTYLYSFPLDYNATGIPVCTKSDNDYCVNPWIVYDYSDSFDVHADQVSMANFGRCSTSNPKVSATYTLNGTIPNSAVFHDQANIILQARNKNDGGYGKFVINDVYVSYKRADYPTNVNYYVGTRFVDTLVGEQKTQKKLLDIAQQVNDACGRPNNGAACTVQLKLVSATGGKMWINTERVEKINPQTAPTKPADLPVVTIPVEPSTPSTPVTPTNPVEPSSPAEPQVPEQGFFAGIWTWLKDLFRGAFYA